MPTAFFPVARVDTGYTNAFSFPRNDGIIQASGGGVGTAGVVIGTAGKNTRLYKYQLINGAATGYSLQFFSKASAPVNGDTASYEVLLPASGQASEESSWGIALPLGFGLAISTTRRTLTLAAANDIASYTMFFAQAA